MSPQANNPDDNSILWYDGQQYEIFAELSESYLFKKNGSHMIAYKAECASNDQGKIIAVEVHYDM